MKVILLHEVPGLGKPGDVKDVAPGYARNYLLPRQLVTPATPSQLATLHERVAADQRPADKHRSIRPIRRRRPHLRRPGWPGRPPLWLSHQPRCRERPPGTGESRY